MKKAKIAIAALCISTMFSFSAMANGGVSLEELQQQVIETQEQIEIKEEPLVDEYEEDKSAIMSIAGATKLDRESETVTEIGAVMNFWAAKLMQLIGYMIAIGLGVVTALDVCYLSVPPLQKILENGHKGKAQNNGPLMLGAHGQGGAQTQPGLGPNVQMNKQEEKIMLVSQEALDSVAEGKNGGNIFKIYLKKRWIVCVMAPIIYVLAATGVLSQFGFMLGEAVSTWIGGISI